MVVISRKVDEWIQVGESILVGPTDIDSTGVRLIAKGRMIGGPEDGATFTRTAELGREGELRLGPNLAFTVIDIRGDQVRLGVQVPRALKVHRKEVLDEIKRRSSES
jgi:carbon storage regulator